MNPLVTYMLGAPIHWLSMFLFMLVLFRQRPGLFFRPIGYSIIIMFFTGLIIQAKQVAVLTAILQPVVMILCVRFLFRFHWKHSLVMVVLVYSIGLAIEWILHGIKALLTSGNMFENLVYDNFSLIFYMILINVILTSILEKLRLGFSFAQVMDTGKQEASRTYLFIGLSFIGLFILGSTSVGLFILGSFPFSLTGMIFIGFIVAWLLVNYYYTEMEEK